MIGSSGLKIGFLLRVQAVRSRPRSSGPRYFHEIKIHETFQMCQSRRDAGHNLYCRRTYQCFLSLNQNTRYIALCMYMCFHCFHRSFCSLFGKPLFSTSKERRLCAPSRFLVTVRSRRRQHKQQRYNYLDHSMWRRDRHLAQQQPLY